MAEKDAVGVNVSRGTNVNEAQTTGHGAVLIRRDRDAPEQKKVHLFDICDGSGETKPSTGHCHTLSSN